MKNVAIPWLIITTLLLSGCAAGLQYGQLKKSHEVARLFTEGEISAAYVYYYYGREQLPSAVIGLDSGLSFESDIWKPVPVSGETIASWLDSRINRGSFDQSSARFQGAEILDPNGNQVGVWYSKYDWGVIRFPQEGVVVVYAPEDRPGALSSDENSGRKKN